MKNKGNKVLKDLEMAKKRDHKIKITEAAIKKVPKLKYDFIPEDQYETIQELAKNVLRISKDQNDSNEVAITYSMESDDLIEKGEDFLGVALGSEHDVDPISNAAAYHLVMSSNECVVIVLHNHPSLSDFSLSDVQFFLMYPNVKLMLVVTNMGAITYLVKGDKFDYDKAVSLFNEAVSLNNEAETLKDLQKAADYFLKSCHMAGIRYSNK